MRRPSGVTALSLFFLVGAVLAGTAAASLAFPSSVLEPMWRLNPHGHQGLLRMHAWAVVLMALASFGCAVAGVGLWCLRSWGYAVAVIVLVIQLAGDVVNVVSGVEPRAAVGVPVVAALLVYLTRASVRQAFSRAKAERT